MGFFDALRMETRFPTGSTKVKIGAPAADMSGSMTDREWANRDERINAELARQLRGQEERDRLYQETQFRRNPNVVYDNSLEKENRLTKYQQEQIRLDDKRIDATANYNQDRVDFQREKQEQDSEVRRMRADVYKFKAENPAARIITQRGGDVIAYDPVNNRVLRSFGSSGLLSEADRIELEQSGATNLEGVRAQNASALEGQRQEGRIAAIGAQGLQQRQTNAAKPGEEMLPTQQKVQQYLQAKQLASNPEYARYFKFSGANDFSMVPPGFMSGDYGVYKDLQNKVYGSNTPAQEPATISPPMQLPNQTPPTTTKPADGKVLVTGPDGKQYRIPSARVPAYTAGGYKVVQPGQK